MSKTIFFLYKHKRKLHRYMGVVLSQEETIMLCLMIVLSLLGRLEIMGMFRAFNYLTHSYKSATSPGMTHARNPSTQEMEARGLM